jgi:excisionase family DNA binding protein
MQDKEALNVQLNPDPLLDVPQSAEFLFTTERHIRHLISKREITVTRIGSKVRIRVSDLTAYVNERTTPAKVGE